MQTQDRSALMVCAEPRRSATDIPTPIAFEEPRSWVAPGEVRFFDREGLATLEAVCERLAPRCEPLRRVSLAERLAERLAAGGGDGWRYDVLPPDRLSTVQGIKGVQETAWALFDQPFTALHPERQDRVLAAVQEGFPPGQIWKTLNAHWFFLDLLAQVTELYYASPITPAQAATGAIIS